MGGLHGAGLIYARRTLQNILPRLASQPGVSVIKDGNTNGYRWDPLKS